MADLKLHDETTGAYQGQRDGSFFATSGTETVGAIDYSDYNGVLHIQMVGVAPTHRRQGVGSTMMRELLASYPKHSIDLGMLTEEGSAFVASGVIPEHRLYRPPDLFVEEVRSQWDRDPASFQHWAPEDLKEASDKLSSAGHQDLAVKFDRLSNVAYQDRAEFIKATADINVVDEAPEHHDQLVIKQPGTMDEWTETYPAGEEPWTDTTDTTRYKHPKHEGVAPHRADRLPGGLADDQPDDDFDAHQLELGTQVELEHTSDAALAREIARDHLSEDPQYYSMLLECEGERGFSLTDLTERETSVAGPMSVYRDWNSAYDSWNQYEDPMDKMGAVEYPTAGSEVSGLRVGGNIPNTGSISSSLHDYTILNGIRIVPMSDFDVRGLHDLFYASNDFKRAKDLAEEIRNNGYIDPLIVVVDDEGPYILEGAHRLGALHLLGLQSFPALVVVEGSPTSIVAHRDQTPVAAIDLDNTILGPHGGSRPGAQPEFGEPHPDAADALGELMDLGWKVLVYTARFSFAESAEQVAQWRDEIAAYLDAAGVPYDEVWVGPKPVADVYVDDRAVTFDGNWRTIVRQVTQPQPLDSHGVRLIDTEDNPNDWTNPTEHRRDLSVDPTLGRDQ